MNDGQFLQVEDNADLVRDTRSNAIVNRNRSAYSMAKRRAEEAQQQRDEIRNATREINSLKSERHEIKYLLNKLVE